MDEAVHELVDEMMDRQAIIYGEHTSPDQLVARALMALARSYIAFVASLHKISEQDAVDLILGGRADLPK